MNVHVCVKLDMTVYVSVCVIISVCVRVCVSVCMSDEGWVCACSILN